MKSACSKKTGRAARPSGELDWKPEPSIVKWAPPVLLKHSSLKAEETSELRRPLEDVEWRRLFKVIWEAVVQSLSPDFTRVADHIGRLIHHLDPLMTAYCRQTCPTCGDPCCEGRKVFFNHTDLVYLAVLGETSVPGQTRTREGQACRYLGREGCRLSRLIRPYVCVWYLCEPQMELLRGEPARLQRNITETLQEIRRSRLLLEALCEMHVG